jgi:hypothetical protein
VVHNLAKVNRLRRMVVIVVVVVKVHGGRGVRESVPRNYGQNVEHALLICVFRLGIEEEVLEGSRPLLDPLLDSE